MKWRNLALCAVLGSGMIHLFSERPVSAQTAAGSGQGAHSRRMPPPVAPLPILPGAGPSGVRSPPAIGPRMGGLPGSAAESQFPGQVAQSAAGRAGERQTRYEAKGIAPMARIQGRLANRVQSRLRNRIEPGYDAAANAASPFEVAEETTRRAGRPR